VEADRPVRSPDPSKSTVGAELARLRRAAKLTGSRLADRVDMSQAKISRIENGVGHTAPDDVRTLAETLGASRETVTRLVEQAEQALDRMTDWRPTPGAVADIQQEVEQLERHTRSFKIFQPAVIPGLIQTSEYARTVLDVVHHLRTGVAQEGGAGVVPEAVSVRLRRQVALADPEKTFHFVITESVLSNRIGAPDNMLAQIRRLHDVAQQKNVTLGIIPADATLAVPPYHGFELLDGRLVAVDVFNTLIRTRGPSDIGLYALAFDALAGNATTDIDEMLNRYAESYLRLSRSRWSRSAHQD
jgi:transcriptional regulator with XRE-family HTH domain